MAPPGKSGTSQCTSGSVFRLGCAVTLIPEASKTEIVGIQLADLNDKQRDELALLVAERSVVVSAACSGRDGGRVLDNNPLRSSFETKISRRRSRMSSAFTSVMEKSRPILKRLRSLEWEEGSR